ncbi:hypothetical protein [Haloarcula rubripromontorii]|uniref:hypothetical protein n=1 Tax=Haloarcula rubripromontorii TaxID=1705562 RepID=UPI00345BAA13
MTDSFEDADVNETVELSATEQLSVYEIGWDEFVGADRDVDNITVDTEVVDTEVDDNELFVEVTGDVTKRDPKEIPVFQSQERWEGRSDTAPEPTPAWKQWAASAFTPAVTLCILAGSAVFSVRLMEMMDLTVNGEPITPPPVQGLFLVMFLIVFIGWAAQYLPRDVVGGKP